MTSAQLFETAMLLLFSLGWCVSIATMVWTGIPTPKSLLFVGLTWAGYLMGILAKVAMWQATGLLSPVIWVYAWNAMIIPVDFGLVVALTRPRRGRRRISVMPVLPPWRSALRSPGPDVGT